MAVLLRTWQERACLALWHEVVLSRCLPPVLLPSQPPLQAPSRLRAFPAGAQISSQAVLVNAP
jgi:hypothetical protein